MSLSAVFKFVWRGWFVGVSVILTPVLLLVSILNPDVPKEMVFAVALVPVIAAMQGVMVGGIVVLGLKLWRPKELR
ncbi:MAG: hypothetical protein R3E35_12320 [Rhodocyclaceae bacterium]